MVAALIGGNHILFIRVYEGCTSWLDESLELRWRGVCIGSDESAHLSEESGTVDEVAWTLTLEGDIRVCVVDDEAEVLEGPEVAPDGDQAETEAVAEGACSAALGVSEEFAEDRDSRLHASECSPDGALDGYRC